MGRKAIPTPAIPTGASFQSRDFDVSRSTRRWPARTSDQVFCLTEVQGYFPQSRSGRSSQTLIDLPNE